MKSIIKKIIPDFALNFYHFCLALAGAILYGFPGSNKGIKIIGITGTSGKTTVVDFVSRILEESGYKTASLSSARFKIGEKEWKNNLKMTMPGRMKIQKFLRQAISEKCRFAVLEVTSEGIRQSRHRFINFDTAVFTNLSPEHIESHKGFGNYRNEKIKLFKAVKNIHIISIDDENSEYFLKIPAEKKIVFSADSGRKTESKNLSIVYCSSFFANGSGISFKVDNTDFNLNLLGRFNVYNALAAISVGKAYEIGLEIAKKALEKAKSIPGRMEIVAQKPFVVVDYAHTPKQLEEVYKALEKKPLVCVLGSCGGGRDKWKRRVLGKVASKYCKEIIITNEDPYDENPEEILPKLLLAQEKKPRKF